MSDVWAIEHRINGSVAGLDWLITVNGEPYSRAWSESDARHNLRRIKAEHDEAPFNEPNEPEIDEARAWAGADIEAEFWGGR